VLERTPPSYEEIIDRKYEEIEKRYGKKAAEGANYSWGAFASGEPRRASIPVFDLPYFLNHKLKHHHEIPIYLREIIAERI
jgi:hypothetical protein